MPQQRWTREQDLAVLYLKLEPKGRLSPTHPDVLQLSRAMGRTCASIWMRKGNFDSLDPSAPGVGLNHPARLTRFIWAEYKSNPEQVLREARRAYMKLMG